MHVDYLNLFFFKHSGTYPQCYFQESLHSSVHSQQALWILHHTKSMIINNVTTEIVKCIFIEQVPAPKIDEVR